MSRLKHLWTPIRHDHRLMRTRHIGQNDVLNYANAAARDAAIPNPSKSFVIWNEEEDTIQIYDEDQGAWLSATIDAWPEYALVNAPDVTLPTADDDPGVYPAWQMSESGPMLARDSSQTDMYAYDTGSKSWGKIADLTNNASWVWLLADNETVLWECATPSPHEIIRATYTGSDIINEESVLTLSTDGIILQVQNVYEHDGTIILGEYASGGETEHNVKIWRSTDNGASWTDVHTQQYGHVHSVHYHEGMGYWVAAIGDAQYGAILYSANDGQSWRELPNYGVGHHIFVAVGLADIGHPTKLLCGHDRNLGIALLDLKNHSDEMVFNYNGTIRDEPTEGFFFVLRTYGDYVFLGQTPSTADGQAMVWFSTNLNADNPIQTLVNGRDGVARVTPVGVDANGHLHCWDNGGSPIAVPLPASYQCTPRLLQVAADNLLIHSESDFAEDRLYATAISASPNESFVAAVGPNNQNAVKASGSSSDSVYVITTPSQFTVQAETTYAGRAKIRVTGDITTVGIRWESSNITDGYTNTYGYSAAHGQWMDVTIPPVTPSNGTGSALNLRIYANVRDGNTNLGTLEVTDIQIQEAPVSEFVSASQKLDGDEYTITRTIYDSWAHKFLIRMIDDSDHFKNASDELLLRTYKVDADNYAELRWDLANGHLRLYPYNDGVVESVVTCTNVGQVPRGGYLWLGVTHYLISETYYWRIFSANNAAFNNSSGSARDFAPNNCDMSIVYDGTDTSNVHMPYWLIRETFVDRTLGIDDFTQMDLYQ